MSEFDITIRAKSREAANALEQAIAGNPKNFEHISTVMVPGVSYELEAEGSVFNPVKEFLNQNPTITVQDLKHNNQKTWKEEVRDLGALILLSERALLQGNEVAKEGIRGMYSGKSRGIPTRVRFNKRGEPVNLNTYQSGVIEVLKASFEAYAKEIEPPKQRPVRSLLRPSEVRILIESTGLAGERIPLHEILESEGVAQITTQKSNAVSRISWNL